MKFKLIFIITFIISALLLVHCASEAAPGGGPPDKTPPALIDVNVKSGSTLVPEDREVIFYFSENLNPDNINKMITVFPISNDKPIIRVRGRSLSVKPAQRWNADVVYTLIIGKGLSDLRGNNLDQPIQISFTPGSEIPQNRIGGKVLGLRSGTTAVISLSRKTNKPDSIIKAPEYYTQTGPDGDFLFDYLPAENFHIAGYVDMDKSNSYKDKFDGVCIPSDPSPLADTAFSPILMEAVYGNFLPAFAIKAESIDPAKTQITFSKDPAERNTKANFSMGMLKIDSLIIKNDICSIYHETVTADTFALSVRGLVDQMNITIPDSTFLIPLSEQADSFFHFSQMGNNLRIAPDPGVKELTAVFQSTADTLDIVLQRRTRGFYKLPQIKTERNGTCLLTLPDIGGGFVSDSLYSVSLKIPALPEFGAVIGTIDIDTPAAIRFILSNDKISYDLALSESRFYFNSVLPGSYDLSYYIDANLNGRRDIGRPYPYEKPEFLLLLDTGIDVRARWDTELDEPYKIVVENGK